MLVALTGVSGFIGSYTARSLRRLGHQVRGLVRESSRRDHIESSVDEFVVGDQSDPESHQKFVEGVEAVIHNAVDWSAREDPIANFEKNVLGSLRLLEAARSAGVKQFLFVSSVAVHHQILEKFNGRIDETHPTWPSGLYGAYKAAVEPHLKAYHFAYGLNTSAWRPAAVYGIDPDLKRSQWYDLIDAARKGQPIDTARGGKITHVQDVADALALAVGDESVAGEFYNLVDGYLYWQVPAEVARDLSGSGATIHNRKGTGPRNQFDTRKAIDFFDRHGNRIALRRGTAGVREYVGELIRKMG